MGKLIWHELSRYISLSASVYAVWASFWGMLFRKFFWDFVGGILRSPGGLQPFPKIQLFITLIVKVPVVQSLAMILGFMVIALEYPLPILKESALHRSIPLRVVMLTLQSFLAVLFYQASYFFRRTAQESGELFFFPSEINDYLDEDIGFQVRLCAALQKKPAERTLLLSDEGADTAAPKDPFAPPYVPQLHVGELSSEDADGTKSDYVILLNKFSVVPRHFVLVTKEFRPQTSPLLPQELVQTYLLLLAARQGNKHYIAFYNCGKNSGASQAHKHIQFIEVENDGPPVERLARKATLEVSGKPFAISSLPYANHVFRLPALSANSSASELSQTLFPPFLSLLDLVISTVRHDPNYPTGSPSYNVILTLEHMHMIPRRQEAYKIEETQELISVNSLGFAGMLLARSDSELERMKQEGIGKILRGVGVESVHELQIAGTSLEAPEDAPLV
ncbi:hypothetical protein BS17DRAFT_715229 [Gyrodon lividus]|nr:hypothetical protein BS17DRAFT_715229 [Gyrodon lividus]